MKNFLRIILYGILTVAFVAVIGSWVINKSSFGAQMKSDLDSLFFRALCVALAVYAVHAGVLRQLRRLSTRTARWVGVAMFIGLPVFGMLLMMALGLEDNGLKDSLKMLLGFLLASLLFFLWFPGFVIYSMPSALPATLPLLIHYLFLATFFAFLGNVRFYYIFIPPPVVIYALYLTLAGYLFPGHRQLREFWFPSRLPRHILARKGFTLIELLIVIAMMAILSAGIVNVTGNTHRMVERQANWRAAVALAEEQFDLWRAQGKLPTLGRHSVDPEIASHFPHIAKQAEVEVIAGPGERFREVWVHVRMRGDANDKTVSLAAILPAGEVKP